MTFHATDAAGLPVYHTNVMMAVGTDVAVVCLESVADPKERQHLLASLRRHHEARPEPWSRALPPAKGSPRPACAAQGLAALAHWGNAQHASRSSKALSSGWLTLDSAGGAGG